MNLSPAELAVVGTLSGAFLGGFFSAIIAFINRRSEERKHFREIVVKTALENWKHVSQISAATRIPPLTDFIYHMMKMCGAGKWVGSLYLDQPRTPERKTRLRYGPEKGPGVFIPWRLRCRRFAHFQEIWYTLPTEGGTIFFRVNSSLRRSRCRIVSAE